MARSSITYTIFTAVDGGWSSWGQWAQCSATCAEGTATRKRTCQNPVTAHGGRPCEGDDTESKTCNLRPCGTSEKFILIGDNLLGSMRPFFTRQMSTATGTTGRSGRPAVSLAVNTALPRGTENATTLPLNITARTVSDHSPRLKTVAPRHAVGLFF